tara:strand:+ start:1672 stop:1878 length:207 start_codon:yes stop_codon:yes gene_type:complete
MKVGDMIKLKRSGRLGIVLKKIRRCVPDGNPNGDFNIEYTYKVACGNDIVSLPARNLYMSVEMLSESR